MADEDELYLANLDEFVNDGDKIVTYKWLSRTLSVPVNRAKQMLYAFVKRQKELKSGSHLNITYVIGGRYIVDGDTAQRYVVANGEDLEETKRTFSVVTSLHIYSVQKCKLKDSNSLYTVDYDIQQEHKGEDNRWSHICCPSAKRLADGALGFRSAPNVNGIAHDDKKHSSSKVVTGESSSSRIVKGPSALGKEQNSKASNSKTKKGQISALEMFAAKPSTSKTEKSSNKSEGDTTKDEDKSKAAPKKSDSNKPGSMTSFFGQNRTVKKVPEKMETTESEKGAVVPGKSETTIPQKQTQIVETNSNKKRELSSEDEEEPLPPKLSNAIKPDAKENKGLKRDNNKVQKKEEIAEQSKSTKAGKKKTVLSDSDEEPEKKPKKKRRKRMKELPKEDSSDDERTVTNGESDKKFSSDKSDSPLPPQQVRPTENNTAGRRRKRKRELKSKTYMNDEGFMVTEKVWESESTDASDDDIQIATEPQVKEKRPSPAKKITKKAHPDIKHRAAKQASLISFFKKS